MGYIKCLFEFCFSDIIISMNDDQKLNQNTKGQDQNQTQVIQAQSQAQSVGSVYKEHGPVGTSLSESMKPSEPSPQVSEELKEIGVKANNHAIHLTPEHTEAGLQHAGASVPVSTTSSSMVNVPQTQKQVKVDIKKTRPTDSLRGLLLEILKNIQRMGFGEQKV